MQIKNADKRESKGSLKQIYTCAQQTHTYTIKPTSMKSSNQIKSNLKCKTNFHFHKMDERYSCAKDNFFPQSVRIWSVFGIRSSSVCYRTYFCCCFGIFSFMFFCCCNSLTWSANHFSLHFDFPFVFQFGIGQGFCVNDITLTQYVRPN